MKILLNAIFISLALASNERGNHTKAFSLFSIYQFANSECSTTVLSSVGQGAFQTGTCLKSEECSGKGGLSTGRCASGFGVCCLFQASNSGSTISVNGTYIINPNFPGNYVGTNPVTYTITKSSSDICWLRLDFDAFNILGPDGTDEQATNGGSCARDSFTVTTSSLQTVPTICGLNTGQHIYIDTGNQASDSVKLAFSFSSDSSTRMWSIKTTQIECQSLSRPPEGCLQYMTSLSGRITSFNFWAPAFTSTHLASQDVTVCIRKSKSFCCVEYQVCENVPLAFSLDSKYSVVNRGDTDTLCSNDYVAIPGSAITCSARSTTLNSKYCSPVLDPTRGTAKINIPICDCTPPFIVRIHTDNLVDSTIADSVVTVSRGLCLDYNQVPC